MVLRHLQAVNRTGFASLGPVALGEVTAFLQTCPPGNPGREATCVLKTFSLGWYSQTLLPRTEARDHHEKVLIVLLPTLFFFKIKFIDVTLFKT